MSFIDDIFADVLQQIDASSTLAEARERIEFMRGQYCCEQPAPATPNHDRAQLEALGQIHLVWVAGNEQYAAILKHGNLEVGHIIEKKRDSFLPWTWVASPSGYGWWSALAGAKTLEEAKAACEQSVRDALEGK